MPENFINLVIWYELFEWNAYLHSDKQIFMKFRSFKLKISFIVGIIISVIIVALTVFAAVTSRNNAIEEAKREITFAAEDYAGNIKSTIDHSFHVLRTLSDNYLSLQKTGGFTREEAIEMLKGVLNANNEFVGMSTLWEANAFDGEDSLYANTPGHDETGQFIPYLSLSADRAINLEPLVGFDIEGDGDYYLVPKRTKLETITEPYMYPVNGVDVFMITLVVPLMENSVFKGITTIDYGVNFIQNAAIKMQKTLYNGEVEVSFISNKGVYLANTEDNKLIGQNIKSIEENYKEILAKIQNGKKGVLVTDNAIEIDIPVTFGKTNTPWQIKLKVPYSVILVEANKQMFLLIVVGITA